MFLYMSVKFVSNLKKSEFYLRVRGSVFFQISLNYSEGGGVKPNSDFVLKFLRFLIMTPLLGSKENVVIDH